MGKLDDLSLKMVEATLKFADVALRKEEINMHKPPQMSMTRTSKLFLSPDWLQRLLISQTPNMTKIPNTAMNAECPHIVAATRSAT